MSTRSTFGGPASWQCLSVFLEIIGCSQWSARRVDCIRCLPQLETPGHERDEALRLDGRAVAGSIVAEYDVDSGELNCCRPEFSRPQKR